MSADEKAAVETGLRHIRLLDSWVFAKCEQIWHLEEPVKCSLCYFRPWDRGADHKAKHEQWARELATLEHMYTIPTRRTES